MSGELIRYDAACKALAEAKSTDEVKQIRDVSEAMRAYARQAKNKQLEIDAAEIRLRAERRIGELIQEQRETIGLATGGQPYQSSTGSGSDPVARPTLAEAGIDKHLADRARKLAAVDAEEFEERLDSWRAVVSEESERVTTRLLEAGEKRLAHVSHNSGDNEWYTPDPILESARAVLGVIDLDPASSKTAQERVKATNYYTSEDDGLSRDWTGRVFMNPPYARGLIEAFSDKLIASWRSGKVDEAIVLVNNATETATGPGVLLGACSAVCFPKGRVRFWAPGKDAASPLQGQMICYFGGRRDVFREVFTQHGPVFDA